MARALRDFGDGVTVSWDDAMDKAISACVRDGGGVVELGVGDMMDARGAFYLMKRPVVLPSGLPTITLRGDGAPSRLHWQAASHGVIVPNDSGVKPTFEGFSISGAGPQFPIVGLRLSRMSRVIDVRVQSFTLGIFLDGDQALKSDCNNSFLSDINVAQCSIGILAGAADPQTFAPRPGGWDANACKLIAANVTDCLVGVWDHMTLGNVYDGLVVQACPVGVRSTGANNFTIFRDAHLEQDSTIDVSPPGRYIGKPARANAAAPVDFVSNIRRIGERTQYPTAMDADGVYPTESVQAQLAPGKRRALELTMLGTGQQLVEQPTAVWWRDSSDWADFGSGEWVMHHAGLMAASYTAMRIRKGALHLPGPVRVGPSRNASVLVTVGNAPPSVSPPANVDASWPVGSVCLSTIPSPNGWRWDGQQWVAF